MGLFNLLQGKHCLTSLISEHYYFPTPFPNTIFVCPCLGSRACAEQALAGLNGTQLGAQNIRLSWGRSPSNKQVCFTCTRYLKEILPHCSFLFYYLTNWRCPLLDCSGSARSGPVEWWWILWICSRI